MQASAALQIFPRMPASLFWMLYWMPALDAVLQAVPQAAHLTHS
jgi:hypothetical protein